MHKLTERQVQILGDAMHGLTAEQSAVLRQLSVSTVKTHRARLLRALGAASIAHAVAIYLRSCVDESTTSEREQQVSA